VASTPKRLPSGNWRTVVRLPNGSRKSITDPIKAVVVAKARDLETARDRGESVHLRERRLTVADWHARWVRSRRVEPNTAAKNASHWRNHIEPRWGDWPVATIRRLHVQTWVTDMEKAGVGAQTITATYHLFSGMLADAVLEQKIPTSPCREIDLPRVGRPTPRWLTQDEYGRIQLALAGQSHAEVWRPFVGLGCFSGLRPGELAGLDVEHVDFDRGLVRVQQVMTRYGLRAYPKTEGSVRSVPFPPEVGEMLWRLAGDRGQGPVFTSPRGRRVSEVNFRNRVWRRALADAGIGYVRPYVLRHTAASWLVQAGVPDREIMKLLGHGSARLVSLYAHLAPDQHDRIRAAWLTYDSRPAGDSRAVEQIRR
jgi:integrase